MEVLARDLLKIDRGAKKVRESMKDPLSPLESDFFTEVNKFVNKYEEELVRLDTMVKETQELYKKMLEKYGERDTTDSEEVS